MRATVDELIDEGEFTRRHTAATDDDRRHMLAVIGEDSVDSLLAHTVPSSIRMSETLHLGGPRSPRDVLDELRGLAARNVGRTSLIGMGYYGTITPPVILRNVLENPAWYTAYTPYQPEISQGRLEALLNFQTMIAELTGFALANASLLDEATAAAEAMTMARRLSKSASDRFVVHHDTHPQTIAVLATRAEPIGIELVVGDVADVANGCFGALFSLPTSSGAITDWTAAIKSVHEAGGLAVVATDLLACTLTVPPAQLGADIAIGSAQRFGVSMGFGGPHAAFVAVGEDVARALPGRLVGVSTDTEGRPALRLALQTREQHIRREKATSNICTNQGLFALRAAVHLTALGPVGLKETAELCVRKAHYAAEQLCKVPGVAMKFDRPFFKEFTLSLPRNVNNLLVQLREQGYHAGLPTGRWYPDHTDGLTVAVTEKRTKQEIDGLAGAVKYRLSGVRDTVLS